MRFSLLCSLLALLWITGGKAGAQAVDLPQSQPDIDVVMNRAKGYPLFEVTAKMTVNADVARSWKVLTDYNRLAEFVPNLSRSQVSSSEGNERIVTQNGFARFLFIRQPIDLVLHVAEQPMQAIDIRLVSGNMREYQARWELQTQQAQQPQQPGGDGRTRISYAGIIAPDFYVPTLFGAALMKSDLRNMLNAVKAEMEKGQDAEKEKRP
ncbi:SRPBCC family protein [Herbaspirillum rhizosphaerae]|uniref:SRPBCC family protein n=1 Tax=Herbaspirillum rhizosphaerae TaxID=346179 RepID=UPI000B02F2AC|nr:SRPBCC family protein [Herbaspirillum rhizosphaerae]